MVDAASALLFGSNQAFVFQLLQSGIDAAGAGLVDAARALGQFLHQLVAVLRAFAEQRKNGQPDLARFKEAAAAAEGESRPRSRSEGRPLLTHDISYDISIAISDASPGLMAVDATPASRRVARAAARAEPLQAAEAGFPDCPHPLSAVGAAIYSASSCSEFLLRCLPARLPPGPPASNRAIS